ncbi:MAG TPA: hypothetical protein VHX42_00455 [Candidatus Babeliales bacterium]|jgi:hypothetical protein|nr:hypothetical protein [Candidatus Babeliales bacterium]
MKKLFFIMLSVFQLNQPMETKTGISPEKNWRDQLDRLDKQKYNDIVHYDLDLYLWKDQRNNIVHKNVSLLAHGWGASPTTMIDYARLEGPHSIPGDKVTFRFTDAFTHFDLFVLESSFGQVEDIKSLLVSMMAVHDGCWVNHKIGCNLFGQSRGAAAIANTLAVLNTKIDEWDDAFAVIKKILTDEDRNQIIKMIKKGVVVLDTPMVNVQLGTHSHVADYLQGTVFESWISDISSLIHDNILPMFTNYSPEGMQGLTSVKKMPQGVKLLVHFQNNDAAVSNTLDKEFTKILINHLGEQNVWIVLGDDSGKEFDDETWQILQDADNKWKIQPKLWLCGGLTSRSVSAHNAGFIALLQSGVLNAFFKNNNCSYYEGHGKLNDALKILEKGHCIKDLDEHFKNYDMNFQSLALVPSVVYYYDTKDSSECISSDEEFNWSGMFPDLSGLVSLTETFTSQGIFEDKDNSLK